MFLFLWGRLVSVVSVVVAVMELVIVFLFLWSRLVCVVVVVPMPVLMCLFLRFRQRGGGALGYGVRTPT